MRIRFVTSLAALLAAGFCSVAQAQFGRPWGRIPETVVIAAEADARLVLVDEAIAHWNRTLAELGSGFRIGPAKRLAMPVSEDALQALSRAIVGGQRPLAIPQALRGLPGDLNIVLAESTFVSFAGPFDADGKRVVAIRSAASPPLSLPNVARNLILHELGHAIGLGHNSDPTMLMCGRPAPCRPDAFQSAEPRLFALTDDERRQLLAMYPPQWKPAPR